MEVRNSGSFPLGDLVEFGNVIGIEFVFPVASSKFNESFSHFLAFFAELN